MKSSRSPESESGDDTTSANETVVDRPNQPRLANEGHDDDDAVNGPITAEDIDLPLRFEARRVLGRGGMGVVVEVLDRNLGRTVAVKVLAADMRDPVHRLRFRREAKAAAVLRHPNIVTVHDVDTERDFIVMELVRGESLRARLRRERVLAPLELRRIALALLDGLAAAHDANIVHRDVKPANILIDEAGTVKLVDFGIASFGDRDLTSTGVRIGTPAYMAPEQLRGRVADVRADLYAVGATLFEAATGAQLHAHDRTPQQISAAVLDATKDATLASAIMHALAERPEDRFQSARAFAAAFGPARRAITLAGPRPLKERRWWPLLGAAAIASAAMVVLVAFLIQRSREQRPASAVLLGHAKQELRTIAVLPFEDHSREPRLDFAASGLPHILATQLKTLPELQVFGYYELLDRVPSALAAPEHWLAAARSFGTEIVINGELFAEQAGIRLVVKVSTVSGTELRRFERMTTVDSVPAATRTIAGEVARVAAGRATRALGEARKFEIDRKLQLAISALERQDFVAADELLEQVELDAPDLAEAQYYRALLNWWTSRDIDEAVTRALAGNLDPAQRGFIEGLRLVWDQAKPTPAIELFRNLAERFPEHRDINYGLFEALYHGGYPAEAMVVYRRLGERHPRFRLGLKHALSYYIAHADEDGMRWAIARLSDAEDSVLWQARAHIARRDYGAAITLLRRHESKSASHQVRRELAQTYLLDGQFGLAADLTSDWGLADVSHRAPMILGLAYARGRSAEANDWSKKAAAAAELATGDDQRERGWRELAAIELPHGKPEPLRKIVEGLGVWGFTNDVVAHTLVAGALGDRAAIERASTSPFPKVVAIAHAYRAEWAKDWAAAGLFWRRAAETATDGEYLIIEQLGRARAAQQLGEHAQVIDACDEVIRPRRFTWAWGGAVGPCLRWSAEAAVALGRSDEAARHATRLLGVRSSAPPEDDLVMAARAILR